MNKQKRRRGGSSRVSTSRSRAGAESVGSARTGFSRHVTVKRRKTQKIPKEKEPPSLNIKLSGKFSETSVSQCTEILKKDKENKHLK